jgi:hypothetical protein
MTAAKGFRSDTFTPLARMLPSVIGGPAWDRGRALMPGRIFAPAVPRHVRPLRAVGVRYCGKAPATI